MAYDLLIKDGFVVDGSGAPRFAADVGISAGKIAKVGRINENAKQTINAEGRIVSPGFVDGHTHMDAQVFWDPLGSCSCYHGVTTVVMGNCGFTLAPCAATDADFVFRNLERAEDLSREAMLTGIDWTWETFPEFMNAVDALPKGSWIALTELEELVDEGKHYLDRLNDHRCVLHVQPIFLISLRT